MKSLFTVTLAFAAISVNAQTATRPLNNFSAFANQDTTFFSGTWSRGDYQPSNSFVQQSGAFRFEGGQSDAESKVDFFFLAAPFDAGDFKFVEIALMLLPSNQAKNLTVSLIDTAGAGAQAVFALDSFSSNSISRRSVEASADIGFRWGSIESFTLSGGQLVGSPVPISFILDSLSLVPIPEPSTYAAVFGVVALGFVAWRRRSRA